MNIMCPTCWELEIDLIQNMKSFNLTKINLRPLMQIYVDL